MTSISPNKLRAVREVLPKLREIPDWSEEKILSFLRFAVHFMKIAQYDGRPIHAYEMTLDKWESAVQMQDEPFWAEFIARIDKHEATPLLRKQRLMMAMRTVGAYLKKSPHAVTEPMRVIMDPNERLSWALHPFKMTETPTGELVEMDNSETVDPGRANANPHQTDLKNPMISYQESILRMTAVLRDLLSGITLGDIKKMSVKERITLAKDIIVVFKAQGGTGKGSMPVNIQKLLVVNSGGREDMEKSLLDYVTEQEM